MQMHPAFTQQSEYTRGAHLGTWSGSNGNALAGEEEEEEGEADERLKAWDLHPKSSSMYANYRRATARLGLTLSTISNLAKMASYSEMTKECWLVRKRE